MWITKCSNEKGWKNKLLKVAAAESIYEIWRYINEKNQRWSNNTNIEEKVMEIVVYRGRIYPKIRNHLGRPMMVTQDYFDS